MPPKRPPVAAAKPPAVKKTATGALAAGAKKAKKGTKGENPAGAVTQSPNPPPEKSKSKPRVFYVDSKQDLGNNNEETKNTVQDNIEDKKQSLSAELTQKPFKAREVLYKPMHVIKEKMNIEGGICSKASLMKDHLGVTKDKCVPKKGETPEDSVPDLPEPGDNVQRTDQRKKRTQQDEKKTQESSAPQRETDSAFSDYEDEEATTAQELVQQFFEHFGTTNAMDTMEAIVKTYGEAVGEEMMDIVEHIYEVNLNKQDSSDGTFTGDDSGSIHGSKKYAPPNPPKLAFGKILPKDVEDYKNGYEWLYDHVMASAVSPKRDAKYRQYMAVPRRLTHPGCIPQYSFRPEIPILKKRKGKSEFIEEVKKWYLRLYKPKPRPQSPKKEKPPHDPKKAAAQRAWAKKNAQPKLIPEPRPLPPTQPSGRKYTKEEWEQHLYEISRPKRINRITPPPPHYNPKALLYEITPRVMELSKPRPLHPEYVKQYLEIDDEKTKMKRARAYKPTERVLKLAEPRHVTEKYRKQFVDPDADVWKVKPEALMYKATKRIKELAKPRVYPEEEYFDPYKVKPSALRYKISDRMLELSKPKGDPKNFQHNCFKDLY